LAHIVKRNVLREAILKAMADNRVEALAYPTIRHKANVIGEMQMGTNCRLSANSGLPPITVPSGFTPDGLPVGGGAAGQRLERAATGQIRLRLRAGHTPPPTACQHTSARRALTISLVRLRTRALVAGWGYPQYP
jgi:Asp-tRNA(Asn)/Glu-tRNA(Gln) amidotransferase A subunit family amidase